MSDSNSILDELQYLHDELARDTSYFSHDLNETLEDYQYEPQQPYVRPYAYEPMPEPPMIFDPPQRRPVQER